MPPGTNLFLIFITGLTTGGLSCLAIQGGLLASVISQKEAEHSDKLTNSQQLFPVLSFLLAKLAVYTLFGVILGLLGNVITLTPQFKGWFQVIIGLYLAGIAMATLNVHPIFRYLIITPPKSFARLLKKSSRSQSLFAPALLGALTIFLPCATTQAMEIIALGTANPLLSGAVMFSFVLGTTPTFLILGFLFSKASATFHGWFSKISAALLIIMAIVSVNGGLALLGSVYTIQNFFEAATTPRAASVVSGQVAGISDGNIQEVNITVLSSGYTPRNITIRKGLKTKVILRTTNVESCARSFSIPSLNIQRLLPETGVETIEFTPTQTGPLVFSCSMGMYTGTFNVI